jgi:hypothetical protein
MLSREADTKHYLSALQQGTERHSTSPIWILHLGAQPSRKNSVAAGPGSAVESVHHSARQGLAEHQGDKRASVKVQSSPPRQPADSEDSYTGLSLEESHPNVEGAYADFRLAGPPRTTEPSWRPRATSMIQSALPGKSNDFWPDSVARYRLSRPKKISAACPKEQSES